MIGYRGASRYLSPDFVDCFAMECDALRYVRDEMGLTNVKIMIRFVRTIADAEGVVALLAAHGLRRGENELQVIMTCELPSNAVIADAFMDHSRPGFASASSPAPPDLRRWTAPQRRTSWPIWYLSHANFRAGHYHPRDVMRLLMIMLASSPWTCVSGGPSDDRNYDSG